MTPYDGAMKELCEAMAQYRAYRGEQDGRLLALLQRLADGQAALQKRIEQMVEANRP